MREKSLEGIGALKILPPPIGDIVPTPSYEKDNAITQLITRAAEVNKNRPAGRSGPVLLGSGPAVRSAALGKEVRPLSVEEIKERDAKAVALGIITSPDNEEDEKYGSLEAAIAAASLPLLPKEKSGPTSPFIPVHPDRKSVTAGQVRLPNFKRIYGYDLIKNVVVVDDIEFPLTDEDVLALKSHAVEIAMDAVVAQLAEAYKEFGVPVVDKLRESMNGGNTAGEGTTETTAADVTGGAQGVPEVDSGDSSPLAVVGIEPRGLDQVVVNPIGQAHEV